MVVLLSAAPAAAHVTNGPRPTNFRSRVVSVTPHLSDVRVRVVDLGASIELTALGATVVVLGYEGEPYLRVEPDGVFENLRSPATYLNQSTSGGTVPTGLDTRPTATPQWRRISASRTARWHDHRAHWMGSRPPPVVAASPGRFHRIARTHVTLIRDGQSIDVTVALDWIPGPSGRPWIPVVGLALAGAFVVSFAKKRRVILAMLVALVASADLAKAIAYEVYRPGTVAARIAEFFVTNIVSLSIGAWIIVVPVVRALLRRRNPPDLGVVFIGAAAAFAAVADLSALWNSELPYAGPPIVWRTAVVIALGVGTGLILGTLVALFRQPRTRRIDNQRARLAALVMGQSDEEVLAVTERLQIDDLVAPALREVAADLARAGASDDLRFRLRVKRARDDVSAAEYLIDGSGTSRRVNEVGDEGETTIDVKLPTLMRILGGHEQLTTACANGKARFAGDPETLDRIGAALTGSTRS